MYVCMSIGWCIHFRLVKRSSSDVGSIALGLLVSERSSASTLIQGVGWAGLIQVYLQLRLTVRPFELDRGH